MRNESETAVVSWTHFNNQVEVPRGRVIQVVPCWCDELVTPLSTQGRLLLSPTHCSAVSLPHMARSLAPLDEWASNVPCVYLKKIENKNDSKFASDEKETITVAENRRYLRQGGRCVYGY